ncbi:MAG: DUF2299 family protein [Nitrososphaerales archaeon]
MSDDDHLLLKEKIEEWLDDEGISFSQTPDLNSFFHLQANLKNVAIHIQESKVRKGVLAVQGILEPGEDQLYKLGRISEEDRKSLFRSLFSTLDKSEYLFLLQEDFAAENWLKIQRTLYIEDLTRTSLLDEMKDLNTKFVNVNYTLNESLYDFEEVPDDKSSSVLTR